MREVARISEHGGCVPIVLRQRHPPRRGMQLTPKRMRSVRKAASTGDNQAEAPELSQAKQLLASEKKGSMLWASEDNELMQLALAEYFQENVGADLVQLSPSAAASLAPEANSVSFEEKYYETLWLTQPDLKWWGNFFSVLGCVVGIVGLVAAPFSMGAGLGLAVLSGVLTLVGVGLTWYADKTKRQYRPTMRYSSDGRVTYVTLRDVSAAEVQASFEKLAREQKLAFKEQEHLDDLQNIEILRQTYYQLHVAEVGRVYSETQVVWQRLHLLKVQLTINKEEDTGLVDERCHLLKLIGAEPHMHFDLDVAHTGMSPEFQEKVEKSKQRLEKARIADRQRRYATRVEITSTVAEKTQSNGWRSFTITVKQLSGRALDEKITVRLYYTTPNALAKFRVDGTRTITANYGPWEVPSTGNGSWSQNLQVYVGIKKVPQPVKAFFCWTRDGRVLSPGEHKILPLGPATTLEIAGPEDNTRPEDSKYK